MLLFGVRTLLAAAPQLLARAELLHGHRPRQDVTMRFHVR
jgi:hypothetical protein